MTTRMCRYITGGVVSTFNRLRGRVVKGVGHLDHVREVVSSIPDRGNIVG